ncbi:MAG: pitrilysin family protein [Clostridia bacterium]|nr:pitrilysin family protein [Clostridia bacterium]
MIPKKIELSGGGYLLALRTDKFKTETLTVSLPYPMDQRRTRLCRLLFGVLKRGCEEYPDISSLSRRLDDLYDANIDMVTVPTGENVAAGFVVECLDGRYVGDGTDILAETMDTLRKMVYSPLLTKDGLFDERVLQIEKRNLCDLIRDSDNDPRIHSYQLCRSMMFEGEPYGLRSMGSIEDIMAAENREVSKFREEFLSMSAPICIYVGSREESEAAKLVSSYFGEFGGKKMTLGDTILKPAVSKMRYVEEEMSVVQGKLTMGFRAEMGIHSEDVFAAMLFNDIFGGSPVSKLFRNVRERMSLCYSCSTSFDSSKGALFMRAGIANENKDRVIDEVLHQFGEIKKGNISDYEIECSKKSIINYYRQAEDSPFAIESYYRTRLMCGVERTPEESIDMINKVTKEDIVRAADKFAPDSVAFIKGTAESKYFEEGDDEE